MKYAKLVYIIDSVKSMLYFHDEKLCLFSIIMPLGFLCKVCMNDNFLINAY
jgi:hypothetical protein